HVFSNPTLCRLLLGPNPRARTLPWTSATSACVVVPPPSTARSIWLEVVGGAGGIRGRGKSKPSLGPCRPRDSQRLPPPPPGAPPLGAPGEQGVGRAGLEAVERQAHETAHAAIGGRRDRRGRGLPHEPAVAGAQRETAQHARQRVAIGALGPEHLVLHVQRATR